MNKIEHEGLPTSEMANWLGKPGDTEYTNSAYQYRLRARWIRKEEYDKIENQIAIATGILKKKMEVFEIAKADADTFGEKRAAYACASAIRAFLDVIEALSITTK